MAQKQATATRPSELPAARHGGGRARATAERALRPLDMGGLDKVIGFALRRAQVAAFQDYAEITSDLGISTVQFSVMRLANANPGVSQTALASALGAEPPRMVTIIDDLARRGLIERLASTVDRRARAIFLTAEGRKLHSVLSKRVAGENRRFARRLRSGDKALLLRMLQDLATPPKS